MKDRKEQIDRISAAFVFMLRHAFWKATDGGQEILALTKSADLHACLATIEQLPDDQLAEFLSMLVSGMPKQLRKQFKKEQRSSAGVTT
jgi:hypothetical protein